MISDELGGGVAASHAEVDALLLDTEHLAAQPEMLRCIYFFSSLDRFGLECIDSSAPHFLLSF
jgi:hypothetical protein